MSLAPVLVSDALHRQRNPQADGESPGARIDELRMDW
jgi:hypothetical protein